MSFEERFEDDHSHGGEDDSTTSSSHSESEDESGEESGEDDFIEYDSFEMDPDKDSDEVYVPQKKCKVDVMVY
jgi:hypothetical protein